MCLETVQLVNVVTRVSGVIEAYNISVSQYLITFLSLSLMARNQNPKPQIHHQNMLKSHTILIENHQTVKHGIIYASYHQQICNRWETNHNYCGFPKMSF